MATVQDLVTTIAYHTDMEHSHVKNVMRELQAGGLLPKSSGRAYARINTRDFTTLLIGVFVTSKLKDSVEITKRYLHRTYLEDLPIITKLSDLIDRADDIPKRYCVLKINLSKKEVTIEKPFKEAHIAEDMGLERCVLIHFNLIRRMKKHLKILSAA